MVQSLERDQQTNTSFVRFRNIPGERPPSTLRRQRRIQKKEVADANRLNQETCIDPVSAWIAELGAEERLAAIRRCDFKLKANLVKMRLAAI